MDSVPLSGDIGWQDERPGTNRAGGMASVSDFEQGQSFSVEAGGRTVALELSAVKPIANSPRDGGGFTLLFKGPRDIALPQAIYRLVRDDTAHEIFIVPVSVDQTGYLYEAVFN
jgi:hypothetical protein